MSKLFETSLNETRLREVIKNEIGPILDRLDQQASVPEPQFLGVKEVSLLLGLEESTVYGLTSQRKIPHYKPGKKLLFKKSEIEEWILAHRCNMINPPKSNAQNGRSCA